jgi:hypothetical protein
VVAGNLICVLTGCADMATSVTDAAGNTYVGLTDTPQGPHHVRLFYCLSALTTGSITITINSPASNGGRRVVAMTFSGGGKTFELASDVGVSNGSASFTTPAYTTTAPGIVVCALYCTGGTTSPHGLSGGTPAFTLQETTPGASVTQLFGFYRMTTVPQVAVTHTVANTASNHLIRFAAFK